MARDNTGAVKMLQETIRISRDSSTARRVLIRISPENALQYFVKTRDEEGLRLVSENETLDTGIRRNAYLERGMQIDAMRMIPEAGYEEMIVASEHPEVMATAEEISAEHKPWINNSKPDAKRQSNYTRVDRNGDEMSPGTKKMFERLEDI
jgi:hypothetical protein